MVTRKSGAGGQDPALPDESEILLEFHRLGNAVKVTAVDPRSLAEATIVGDPALGERALGLAALRKLRYVLRRRAEAAEEHGPRSGGPGRGTLV